MIIFYNYPVLLYDVPSRQPEGVSERLFSPTIILIYIIIVWPQHEGSILYLVNISSLSLSAVPIYWYNKNVCICKVGCITNLYTYLVMVNKYKYYLFLFNKIIRPIVIGYINITFSDNAGPLWPSSSQD